jgi:ligand-binding sensor domain-containing protein
VTKEVFLLLHVPLESLSHSAGGRFVFSSLSRLATRVVLLGTALLLCSALSAQEQLLPVFHFNRLTTADGLPSNEIRSNVVRDRQGFIWFGTENGLARYDGYICKVYRLFSSSNSVMTLHVDTKGRLWIGAYASGLSLYDP